MYIIRTLASLKDAFYNFLFHSVPRIEDLKKNYVCGKKKDVLFFLIKHFLRAYL